MVVALLVPFGYRFKAVVTLLMMFDSDTLIGADAFHVWLREPAGFLTTMHLQRIRLLTTCSDQGYIGENFRNLLR